MSKTSKIIIGIIVAIIVIGGIWYGVSREPAEKEEIKIGVIGHFSGSFADYGIPMRKGIELTIDEINKNGGINGHEINLIAEDDNSDPNSAASAMNKLVSIDKVDYILSAQGSGITSAISPIAQSNKKILMITLGSAPGLTNVGDYIFRSVPSDVYQGVRMVELMNNNLKSSKVAGLYINNAYGVGIKEIVNTNQNVNNVLSEMFESGAKDFKTQLLKIKESSPDTLVIVAYNEYPIILKQIKELGIEVKIVASETFKDENILQESGATAEGVFTFVATPKDYVNFTSNYEAKFNEKPSAYSMYAYDGAMALIKAIEKAGNTVEGVKKELLKVSFNGASDKFGLDEKRERVGVSYDIYIVKNGQFAPYEE